MVGLAIYVLLQQASASCSAAKGNVFNSVKSRPSRKVSTEGHEDGVPV